MVGAEFGARFMRPRLIAICAYLAAVAAFGVAVWWVALGAALGQLEQRAQADLSLASDRLISQLQSYRELAVLLADHPSLVPLVTGGSGDVQKAQDVLLSAADKTGSLEIVLLNQRGAVVAQSHPFENTTPRDLGKTAFFERASQGGLGSLHAQIAGTGVRSFTFAAPIFGMDRKFAGAVAVSLDLEAVETDWRASPTVVFFTDASGVVFVSNRTELLYRSREPFNLLRVPGQITAQPSDAQLTPFFPFRSNIWAGVEIWAQDELQYLPTRALHITQPLPLMNLQGEILADSREAEQLALFQALVAGALGLILGAAILILSERRRGFLQRIAVEEEANARLEARVAKRTAALEQAQQELLQASKLSALGQMSAGISHELNQPLMAIRSFAENGEEFLRRGKADVAGENLGRINEPLGQVDVLAAIDAVLDLSDSRLRHEGVQLTRAIPEGPIFVHAGEVRLQQVLINLISNAVDAMEDQPEKHLSLSVTVADTVCVAVRDSGPGLKDAEKIFDPFYSTKEVGRSEGMGLGLSISYGLVQSFGGDIRGRNHPEGGAEFTIELTREQPAEAAA